MKRHNPTERIGVSAIDQIVSSELKSIFREQLVADMGIDAHIEIVEKGNPTGKLIAIQIKTGESHFKQMESSYVYYGKNAHLDYWLGHSLPVIIIGHLPKSGITVWCQVTKETVERTAKRWKIKIPKTQFFDSKCLLVLKTIAEGPPSQQRLRRLSIDESLMRHILAGGRVSLEMEDWVNKSLGRTPVKVFLHDSDGEEILEREWFQYYTGHGMKSLAEVLFPWAVASVDEEFYDENEDSNQSESFAYYDEPDLSEMPITHSIRPYREAGGEVEYYRLKLELNNLGTAFIAISDYIHT